jgi:hypothetical protein
VGRVRGLDSKERFDRVNEARKTLATIMGGIALPAGFFGTWQILKVAQISSDTSQKALLVSQQGQITDRFTKAIEQLGAVDAQGVKKMVVRLGGIYALERIANESERDHWPIVEVLCTYVRNVAPIKPQQSTRRSSPVPEHPEPDIQAILTVLGRRDRKYEKSTEILDLNSADLRGADLSRAYFSGAYLNGTSLNRANLAMAYVIGANLSNAKDLTQEQIDEAYGDSTTKLPANLHMPESWKK